MLLIAQQIKQKTKFLYAKLVESELYISNYYYKLCDILFSFGVRVVKKLLYWQLYIQNLVVFVDVFQNIHLNFGIRANRSQPHIIYHCSSINWLVVSQKPYQFSYYPDIQKMFFVCLRIKCESVKFTVNTMKMIENDAFRSIPK